MAVSSKTRRRSWLPRRPRRGSGAVPETRPAVGEAAEPGDDRLRRAMLVGVLVLAPPLLLYLYYRSVFPGLVNSAALDFAQLGRNLSEGRGFVTYVLRPLTIQGHDAFRQPETVHGPLYPFLLGLTITAFGARDSAVALVSGVFYLLTVPAVYLLGKRMFGAPIGLVTALIFAVNALMLEYGISGLHITLYTFLTTVLLMALYRVFEATRVPEGERPPPVPRGALVSIGLLLGLLYLTDPVFVWVIPAVLGLLYWATRGRGRQVSLYVLPILGVLLVPWMVRNWALTGNPVFGDRGYELWMHTNQAYPGTLLYRSEPSALIFSVGTFKAVLKKILLGGGTVIQNFPQVTASWVLAFFLPCLLFRFRNGAANLTRTALMVFFLASLAGILCFQVWMPIFVATIPAMLIFSIAYLVHLSGRASLSRAQMMLASMVLGGMVLYPLGSQILLERRPEPATNLAVVRSLSTRLDQKAVVISDVPWMVAWYANRPSVWLPVGKSDLQSVQTRFPEARQLYLSRYVTLYGDSDRAGDWQRVYQQLQAWNLQYIQAKLQVADVSAPPASFPIPEGEFSAMTITPQPPRAPGEWRNGLAKLSIIADRAASLP